MTVTDLARTAPWWVGLALLYILTGCTRPLNPPLAKFDPQAGYRFETLASEGNSDEVLLILTFSGGGTRAAALAYGAMRQLRNTDVEIRGTPRRLLDEVDVISSVSGGSFTAAYYGLFREGLFETFDRRVLKARMESALFWKIFSLANLIRMGSATFSRTELALEYYDKDIFHGKTFADVPRKRPLIVLNATDMTHGMRFEFTQDQFDLLYSDMTKVPIAHAVMASSAFPVVFNSVTLGDYNTAQADYREPAWVAAALADPDASSARQLRRARQIRSYLRPAHAARSRGETPWTRVANLLDHTPKPWKFVKLLDGGVADNLGARMVLDSLDTADHRWSLKKMIDGGRVRKVVVIMVDAQAEPAADWDKRPEDPSFADLAAGTINWLVNNYTFELKTQLKQRFGQLNRRPAAGDGPPVTYHLIEVSFDHIDDPDLRRRCKQVPTALQLDAETVDMLTQAGADVLRKSKQYNALVHSLRGRIRPVAAPNPPKAKTAK